MVQEQVHNLMGWEQMLIKLVQVQVSMKCVILDKEVLRNLGQMEYLISRIRAETEKLDLISILESKKIILVTAVCPGLLDFF